MESFDITFLTSWNEEDAECQTHKIEWRTIDRDVSDGECSGMSNISESGLENEEALLEEEGEDLEEGEIPPRQILPDSDQWNGAKGG
ncbi:hypothetical protein NDU88_004855 [Pleurodeles waltl]|uniref:Uncharacterized protein n=1 Tax=Pleurodeles waltl TaxID=8319 RepID=A0AAV7NNI3_PLEWA|nr:hypothetical protein NDU88_004855 [Pleurodeles waltl]